MIPYQDKTSIDVPAFDFIGFFVNAFGLFFRLFEFDSPQTQPEAIFSIMPKVEMAKSICKFEKSAIYI